MKRRIPIVVGSFDRGGSRGAGLQRAAERAGLRYERLIEAYESETPGAVTHNDGGVT